jgi:HK97 gp10 family phage protein
VSGRQAFRVDGLRDLDQALMQLSKATAKNVVDRTLMKAAEPLEKTAQQLAPKRTGKLADSLTVGRRLSNRQRARHRRGSEVEVFVGADALPHAHLQEFGTIDMPASPFMRPAWEQHKHEILGSISELLGHEIDLAAMRAARKAARQTKTRGGRFDTRRSKG